MDEKLKIEASMAFFRAHGTPVDGAYGNIASNDGLALYQNAATSKIPKQTGPGIPDDGRRTVGYAYQYNAASNQLNFWNANFVTGKPNREIGLARFNDNTAELWDAFPRLIARTTQGPDGAFATEQLYTPPKPEIKEDTRSVARRLSEDAPVLATLAALQKIDNGGGTSASTLEFEGG